MIETISLPTGESITFSHPHPLEGDPETVVPGQCYAGGLGGTWAVPERKKRALRLLAEEAGRALAEGRLSKAAHDAIASDLRAAGVQC